MDGARTDDGEGTGPLPEPGAAAPGELPPRALTGPLGVVAALPEEFGALGRSPWRRVHGLELFELELSDGARALAAISGVGKVRAARAATALLHAGADGALLSVGVCGALRRSERVGDLLVCERAVQADLAVRADRERHADPALTALWRRLGGALPATFLTADRPVLSPWRRLRLARAFLGPCAAEMETAAVAWVAEAAGVPWAALRAVSDDVGLGRRHGFVHNFPAQAGRAAATLPALAAALGERAPSAPAPDVGSTAGDGERPAGPAAFPPRTGGRGSDVRPIGPGGR